MFAELAPLAILEIASGASVAARLGRFRSSREARKVPTAPMDGAKRENARIVWDAIDKLRRLWITLRAGIGPLRRNPHASNVRFSDRPSQRPQLD